MNLHPELQRFLMGFAARRRKLLCARGVITGAGVLMGCAGLGGILDGVLVYENQTRLAVASTIYLFSIGVVWFRAGKQLLRLQTPLELAKAIEHTAPSLKGGVISAVELGTNSGTTNDSQFLRDLLQQRITESVARLNPTHLLPWNKLKSDVVFLAIILTALIGAILSGGERFENRSLRLLLPFAKIDRLSETQIEVVSPSPRDGHVPADEKIKIIAKIRGNRPSQQVLLLSSSASERKPVPMESSGDNRFQADLNVGKDPLDYQVKAGDGVTSLYRLTPVQRPHAVNFTRHYTPPTYSGLPEYTETSSDGTIKGLEGTSVALTFRIDQAISEGTLEYSQGGFSESIPLTKDPVEETILRGLLPLRQSGVYSLRMRAQSTAFEAARGNQQEIIVEPDAAPLISLQSPEQNLTLPLGDKVQCFGTADDDLQISSITQEVRLNNGTWTALPSQFFTDKHLKFSNLWDPLGQQPKIGDAIAIRFVATDSRGQRAESRVVQISFAARGLFPAPPPELAAQRSITKQTEDVSRRLNEAAKALQDGRLELESKSPNLVKQFQAFARARQALDMANENASEARELLMREIRRESDAAALDDLRLQSYALNRVHVGEIEPARRALNELSEALANGEKPQSLQTDVLRHAAESTARGAALALNVKEAAQTRLASVEAGILAKKAHAAGEEQTNLTGQQRTEGSEQTIGDSTKNSPQESLRRQQVNQSVSSAVLKDLQSLMEHSSAAAGRMKGIRTALQNSQQAADRLLNIAQTTQSGSEEAIAESQNMVELEKARTASLKASEAGNTLAKTLTQVSDELMALGPVLEEASVKARGKLRNDEIFHAERISQIAKEIELISTRKQTALPEKSRGVAQKLEAEAAVLRAHASVEAARRHSSPLIDFELRTAATALDAAAPSVDAPLSATKTRVQDIAEALQKLEAVARLDEARKRTDGQSNLPGGEMEGQAPTPAFSDRATGELMQRLAPELRRARLPEEAAVAAEAAYKAFQGDPSRRVSEIRGALQSAAEAAHAAAQTARATLRSLAPSLSSRMDALADQSDAEAVKTQAIQAAPAKSRPSVSDEALRSASKLNSRIEDLGEELRADASRQNTMSEEGRASARDADMASAQLKDSARALAALKEASRPETSASQALERAVDQQKQTAQKLRRLAEHFRNIESGDRDKIAETRKNLRNSEAQTGMQAILEEREKRAAELAELSSTSIEKAQPKLEQLAASHETAQAQSAPAQSESSNASQQAIQRALKAAKSGMSEEVHRAIHEAAEAQEEAFRIARAVEGKSQEILPAGSLPQPSSESRELPSMIKGGDPRWGNLPKHIADDLMKGKRERAPAEYRAAIEAYFQAVAERTLSPETRP